MPDRRTPRGLDGKAEHEDSNQGRGADRRRRGSRVGRAGRRSPHLATHVMPLDQVPHGYELFKTKDDGCTRSVFRS